MERTATLSEQVAEEVRAMLARKRMSGRELARQLDVSQAWVSYRLTGHQEIGLNDLQRIARALDVEITALIPATAQRTGTRHDARGPAGETNRG
jgi:transcriptional regulator with XRE-family HTH domain